MNDESEAYVAIARLQRTYADIGARQAWDEVQSLATPDARFVYHTQRGRFTIEGAAFAEMAPKMSERFNFHLPIPMISSWLSRAKTGQKVDHVCSSLTKRATLGACSSGFTTTSMSSPVASGCSRAREYRPLGRRSAGRLESFPLEDWPL